MHRFATGAHQDDHALRIRRAVVFVKVVPAPREFAELRHRLLHNVGALGVEWIHRLARLEVHVRILRRAAQYGPVGREAPGPMFKHALLADHRAHHVRVEHVNLAHFM